MSEAMISVSHVSKVVSDVGGPLAILRDIDFSVKAGESVAILGASGSGKSTLLSIMAGLDTPTQGKVSLAGQPIFDMTEDQRAAWRGQKLGFVFQNFQLMGHLSALENVMLPLELAGARNAAQLAKEILSQVGLAERLKHFPKVLSGGEQPCTECGGTGMIYREAMPVPGHVKSKVEKYKRLTKATHAAHKRLDANNNGIPDSLEDKEVDEEFGSSDK
ncbi:MAG: Lipoprotein-releasing system ATP-binding protein LolD, partial [Pseudomonadota bacterium]